MNLSNMILQGARYFPDKEAIVFEDTRFTYRELNNAVGLVASYLKDRGIKRNDRVALYCENRPEWIMLYYGIIRLGAVVVCVSSAYKSSELEYLLTDSQPACVVTSENLVDNIPNISKSSQIDDILVIESDSILATLGLKNKASSETSLATGDCDGNDTCVILIHEAYGMTESSSLVTFNHLYRHKVGSVGTAAGVVEVRIADDRGEPAAEGGEGEILIQGPNVMKGYYNRPTETARAMAGGWLHSGDMGRIDAEGYLYVVDRIKDMIISGGLNIYPTDVENVLYRHDSVEECAVAGLPHEEYGEAVAAFVQLKPGREAVESDLFKFCKKWMASYKAPRKIVFVKDFPRTPQGKLLKRELRKYSF